MRRLLLAAFLILSCSGCTIIGGELKEALRIQNHYTRQYVAATLPNVQNEQIKGIGSLLEENSKKIDKMLE